MSTDCTYFASIRYLKGRDALDEFTRVWCDLDDSRDVQPAFHGLQAGDPDFCVTLTKVPSQPIDLSKPDGARCDQWLVCYESADRERIVTALAVNPHRNQIEIREVPIPIRTPASVIPIDGDDHD